MPPEEKDWLVEFEQKFENFLSALKRSTSRAVTALEDGQVEEIFGLKPDHNYRWNLNDDELCSKPEFAQKRALIRARLDVVLMLSLADEKRGLERKQNTSTASSQSYKSLKSMKVQFEKELSMPVKIGGQLHKLNGKADFTLWYGSFKELESHLVIVEAKAKGKASEGDQQCHAYMGMIHHARKKTGRKYTTVFGISTDSYIFSFFRTGQDSRLSTMHLVFGERSKEDELIISHIRRIIRQTASLKPVTGHIPAGSSASELMDMDVGE
ncbi:hypothetical protein VTN77DRAFT_3557 [Rasamsonia byssochlamydoides]|uniref:uncharacterized protein n=1 Tax=Rasamsonia byssochlamydoides TaxID=89139 RepID=UPI0037424274